MPFPCPACQAPIAGDPEKWLQRCPSCGVMVRSRAVEAGGEARVYDVEVAGRPETRRRVQAAWGADQRRRLAAWLLWSSVITVGLVGVLYALARWLG